MTIDLKKIKKSEKKPPKKPNKNRNISINFDIDTIAKIDAICEREYRTRSNVIKMILEKGLENDK